MTEEEKVREDLLSSLLSLRDLLTSTDEEVLENRKENTPCLDGK